MITGCVRPSLAVQHVLSTRDSRRCHQLAALSATPAISGRSTATSSIPTAPQRRNIAAMAVSRPDQVKPADCVSAPAYTADELSTGIVHFGIGNFARSHQMSYMEELLSSDFESNKGWAYTGAGVRESSGKKKQKIFGDQGNRYCIYKSNGDGSKQEVQVVGAIREILTGPLAPGKLLKRISAKTTRIVSLTITEKGYATPFSDEDGKLLKLAQQAQGDTTFAQANDNAQEYNGATAMGYIISGLAARRALGHGGMTILSCDNIPENGKFLRTKIMEKLESVDKDLKQWVEENCTFPNCMIDSITPATDDKLVSDLEENFGIQDSVPVPREFFKQWVIEDNFVAGRPAWEDVGAQLVEDVYPYELAKIRMLNVGHSVLALAGILKHVGESAEAANDAQISKLYKGIFEREIRPVLEDVPGMSAIDLEDYQQQLVERFTGGLPDELGRMLQDTSEKLRMQAVPAICAGYEAGLDMQGLACTVACWGHYIREAVEGDGKLEDPRADEIMQAMKSGGIEKLLDNDTIFQGLVSNEEWRKAVVSSYNRIEAEGLDATIESLYPTSDGAKKNSSSMTAVSA